LLFDSRITNNAKLACGESAVKIFQRSEDLESCMRLEVQRRYSSHSSLIRNV
jgi:hypothetical protein